MNDTRNFSRTARLAAADPRQISTRAGSPLGRTKGRWGLVVLLAAGAAVLPVVLAASGTPSAAPGGIEGNAIQGSKAMNQTGRWTAEREHNGDKVWLQFVRRGQDGIWVPLPSGQPGWAAAGKEVRFELRRDAGTFSFTGQFAGDKPGAKGSGSYVFQPDPRFGTEMAALGYRVPGGEQLLELAIRDVTPAYAREMQALGYRDLSLERLLELRSHDVTPQMIRELAELGYKGLPPQRLVEFRMYDVTPSLIRELAALHYNQLPAQQLVDFRIQDVTPKAIRELADLGYGNLSAQQLIELRVQGVDAAFIRDLQNRGYHNLSVAQLIDLRLSRSASLSAPRVRNRS